MLITLDKCHVVVTLPFWIADKSVSKNNNNSFNQLITEGVDKGKVTILEDGTYLIYVQVRSSMYK